MNEQMLLCDLSIRGKFRAGLWDRRRGLFACEQYLATTAEEFEKGTLSFLEQEGSPFITAAALAAPGWEQDGVQNMPNHGYSLERDWLRKVFNVKRVHVVNPTVARALSIPTLDPNEYEVFNAGEDQPDQVKCIIGTGPGLGMAILVADGFGGWTAFSGAGGHSDLTVDDKTEHGLLNVLTAKYGHVSRERVVSLGGLCEIWSGLNVLDGLAEPEPVTPEAILAMAEGGDSHARQAIELCISWLARTASDMALITGARGGVYVTGELLELLDAHIDRERFRTDFQDKGRLSNYMKAIPIYAIKSRESEFKGLATLFE